MTFLMIAALVSAGVMDAQRLPPPSRTLDVSVAVDDVRACGDEERGDEDILRVRFRIRNFGPAPVRVLPDTVRVTRAQIVRTIEEFVPMGVNTPGVHVLSARPAASGSKGAARLLGPGESVDVMIDVSVTLASPLVANAFGALEPGHYFLELAGVVESATPSTARFAAASVVSPYIGIEIGARPRVACGA